MTGGERGRGGGVGGGALDGLAQADASRSLGVDRRQALWAMKGLGPPPLPLFAASEALAGPQRTRPEPALPEMTLGQHVAADYAALSLSPKRHPGAFLPPELAPHRLVRAPDLSP